MLPFCGYNMADYWAHWLSIADRMDDAKLPRIFYVNWFRKSTDGRYCGLVSATTPACSSGSSNDAGRGAAVETPIGYLPAPDAIDTDGLDIPVENMVELLRVDRDKWRAELPAIVQYCAQFGARLPPAMTEQIEALRRRLG